MRIAETGQMRFLKSAEIAIKYEGYIARERQMADKIKRLEKIKLDENFDYDKLKSISTEARQKLSKIKPGSIGQASQNFRSISKRHQCAFNIYGQIVPRGTF